MEIKSYNINWAKVRTVKDLKEIVAVLASRLVINHEDAEDTELYNKLKHLLSEVVVTSEDVKNLEVIDDDIEDTQSE